MLLVLGLAGGVIGGVVGTGIVGAAGHRGWGESHQRTLNEKKRAGASAVLLAALGLASTETKTASEPQPELSRQGKRVSADRIPKQRTGVSLSLAPAAAKSRAAAWQKKKGYAPESSDDRPGVVVVVVAVVAVVDVVVGLCEDEIACRLECVW